MTGFKGLFYTISEWGVRLVYINFLWIVFSILGLIVFGISPATVALFSVTRKWINGETDLPVFTTFCSYYKQEFVKSNLVGGILVLIGFSLWSYLVLLDTKEGTLFGIFKFLIMSLTFMYIIILMYIFPVLTHYNLKILTSIKNALIFGILHPFRTVIMAIGFIVTFLIMTMIPGLLPFYSTSLIALFFMRITEKVFTYQAVEKF